MGSSLMTILPNTTISMNADFDFTLHKSLEEVYNDLNFEGFGKPCDTRLRTDDGTEFQVHSAVLSAKSEFFRALFSIDDYDDDDDRNCTVIHGIKPDVFEEILIYMWSGRIDLNKENMMHLLVAADSLMIDSLLCEARVFVMKNKSVQKCIELFVTSYRIKGLDMKDQCSRFLLLCFERAVKCSEDEAYDLPLSTLLYFLGHKSINVSEERFIWSFIEEWVQKDNYNRLPMVPELLKCLYMDEIDDELALDIISSPIIQKHVHCKDFGDSLPMNACNKSRLVTLLGEDIQFIPGARLPPCLYFVTKDIPEQGGVDMFMTYDDSPDVWRKLGSLHFFPVKLFRIDHKIYVFYDYSERYREIDGGFIYDLLNYKITVMDPFPSYFDFVVESSGRIYAFGDSEGEESGEVQVYVDEEDGWKEVSPMQPMLARGAVSANRLLYVIGEKDARMFMQVYHPSSNEWKTASPPNIRRIDMTAVEYRGRIFVVGGLYRPYIAHCREVEAYDPARDEWSLCPPLPFNLRSSSKCGVMRGRLYVFDDGGPVFWDDSGEWRTVPSHQNVSPYRFCSIEGEEVVSEIMKKNRAACTTEWHETRLGMIFA